MFPHSRPYFSDICLNTCWNEQSWTLPLDNTLVWFWAFFTEGHVSDWQYPWYRANTLGWVLRKLAYMGVSVHVVSEHSAGSHWHFSPNAWSFCAARVQSFAVRAGEMLFTKSNCSDMYFPFADRITGNVSIKKSCWKHFEFLITFFPLFLFCPFSFLLYIYYVNQLHFLCF